MSNSLSFFFFFPFFGLVCNFTNISRGELVVGGYDIYYVFNYLKLFFPSCALDLEFVKDFKFFLAA